MKYKCSEAILWKDWANQDSWIQDVFELNNALGKKCVAGLMAVVREGWKMYRSGDNSNARVGALRVAKEGYSEMLEFLQKIGVFDSSEAEPTEIRLSWMTLPNIEKFANENELAEFYKWRVTQKYPVNSALNSDNK